ncbi:class I SAM-dependent RNA methyltransferase [Chachezhania antarctica]|uniref:class I SAM-dependent RNA methyltransferase n=1 Tax=Chachezhania antarctica TaxID=2340860 RepID=UPI000EAB7626|nr:class I SAM-dependent RNA methyltransferase [Chachezhania antarctica]|tara:strand:- start:2193 stop:3413 length:1221 start_codon:yes stop_codon:yes gene_type:complete
MQLTVERLGHLGDGIAQGPYGPVIVPRALPGETITGTLEDDHLEDVRIVTPSLDRVRPPCRHAASCGGCQVQHVSDDVVRNWRTDTVKAALAAQGLEAEFLPMHVSPPQSRRRASVAARRTKKGALVGFHGRASDTIVEIPDCQLLSTQVTAVLPLARDLAIRGGSRKGELTVTITASDSGADVAVSGGKDPDVQLRADLAGLAEGAGLARLTWNGETIAQRVPPFQNIGRAQVAPPPGAFLQATAEGEAALLADVRDIVGKARKVVDLFAGCGTFSIPLAETAEVHAVEGEKAMTAALDRGWRDAQGLKKVTTEARDLFRRPLTPDELNRHDAIVLDPPRAGAAAQVAEIARCGVPSIAYVSCNPSTFARDARALVDSGYRLDSLRIADQFRWSAHVELVARLTR